LWISVFLFTVFFFAIVALDVGMSEVLNQSAAETSDHTDNSYF